MNESVWTIVSDQQSGERVLSSDDTINNDNNNNNNNLLTTLMNETAGLRGDNDDMMMNNGTNLERMSAERAALQRMYEETIAFENIIGIVIPTFYAVIIVIGLLGNILVLLVLGLNKNMRNSTNTLVLNLALSDLLFLTLCVPFSAADYALPIWVFADWWCSALNYLQFVSAYASVWTLVLMSVDRFLAVVFPMESLHWRTSSNTLMVVGVLWLAILLICIPVLFQHEIVHYEFFNESRSTCAYVRQTSYAASVAEIRAYYFSFNIFGYILPLGGASILYCIFLRKLWTMSRPGSNPSNNPNLNSNRQTKREESVRAKKKVTIMVSGVILTFAVCWLPLNICFASVAFTYPKMIQTQGFVILQIFSQVLAYTNSCLNPILYAFLSENFRRGFARVLGIVFVSLNVKSKESGAYFGADGMGKNRNRRNSFYQTTALPGATSSHLVVTNNVVTTPLTAGRTSHNNLRTPHCSQSTLSLNNQSNTNITAARIATSPVPTTSSVAANLTAASSPAPTQSPTTIQNRRNMDGALLLLNNNNENNSFSTATSPAALMTSPVRRVVMGTTENGGQRLYHQNQQYRKNPSSGSTSSGTSKISFGGTNIAGFQSGSPTMKSFQHQNSLNKSITNSTNSITKPPRLSLSYSLDNKLNVLNRIQMTTAGMEIDRDSQQSDLIEKVV